MSWRADYLRRSTGGAVLNEPTLVLSLDTAGPGAGGAGGSGTTMTFEAGPQEAAALLLAVTEALDSADRLVDGPPKAASASKGRR